MNTTNKGLPIIILNYTVRVILKRIRIYGGIQILLQNLMEHNIRVKNGCRIRTQILYGNNLERKSRGMEVVNPEIDSGIVYKIYQHSLKDICLGTILTIH